MAITLARGSQTLTLPSGLRWTEEYAWQSLAQTTEYGLTGALIVQQGVKQAGRTLTLEGGEQWAWIKRSDLETLWGMLNLPQPLTLTLHDARQFVVLPDLGSGPALSAKPLPRVLDSGLANPGPQDWYVIESIRFIIIGTP